jgi:hypothetical protein
LRRRKAREAAVKDAGAAGGSDAECVAGDPTGS